MMRCGWCQKETDGLVEQDQPDGHETHACTRGIAAHTNAAINTPKCVSTRPEDSKWSNLPSRSTRSCKAEVDGIESCPGVLNIRIHAHSDGSTRIDLNICQKS